MSSKIRSVSELQDCLDSEFAWRKKELHEFRSIVWTNKGKHKESMSIRAAVALLYAHWEGFIKNCASFYVEFVSRQKLKNCELSNAFLAIAAGGVIEQSLNSGNASSRLDLVDFFQNKLTDRSIIPYSGVVKTYSNLNSSVFKEIVLKIGLQYSVFESKEKLIDEKLVGNRNAIAHGNYILVDYEEYMETHESVLTLMQEFYNGVSNAALMKEYRVR